MTKKQKVTKNLLIVGICLGVIILGFAITAIILAIKNGSSAPSLINLISSIIVGVLALAYSFAAYKLPNNDIIKYCLLLFAFATGLMVLSPILSETNYINKTFTTVFVIITLLVVMVASCVGLKLKKYEDCIYLFIINGLLMLINFTIIFIQTSKASIPNEELLKDVFGELVHIFSWCLLGVCYASRYYDFKKIKEKNSK